MKNEYYEEIGSAKFSSEFLHPEDITEFERSEISRLLSNI
jgi:hypothetical protein